MNRLNIIKNQLKSKTSKPLPPPKVISSALDYLKFSDDVLTQTEKTYITNLREFLKSEVTNQINEYVLSHQAPVELYKKINNKFPGLIGLSSKGHGSAEMSHWLAWSVLIELARCDLSLATFFMIDGGELVMNTIQLLGSEKQKNDILPKMNTLDIIGSFCLTEPEYGSDASSLKTSSMVNNDNNTITLNGTKRWIGNASIAQILIMFARNKNNNEIEGYIVETNRPGVVIKPMKGKLSTQAVVNCDIELNNVVIPKDNMLPKATSFKNGASKMLFGSRLGVAWIACGAAIGAYERVIDYCSKRIQFGKPLTSFQLVQEKIARIMGNTQSMIYLTKRMSELFIAGKLSIGQVGLCKAYCTTRAREVLSVAREVLGGNGILIENWVMKTLLDIESLHTYEGTADINMLVAAKEMTGVTAFK